MRHPRRVHKPRDHEVDDPQGHGGGRFRTAIDDVHTGMPAVLSKREAHSTAASGSLDVPHSLLPRTKSFMVNLISDRLSINFMSPSVTASSHLVS